MIKFDFDFNEKKSFAIEDNKEIGFAKFSDAETLWIISSTFVDSSYRGQSIGEKLIDEIYKNAKIHNVKLTATCPFVIKLFKNTDKYNDLLIN